MRHPSVVNSDPARQVSSIQREVVVIANAISVSIAPDDVSYSVSTCAVFVPLTIPGIMAIYKFAALAIMFGPTPIVAIVPTVSILCQRRGWNAQRQ